MVVLINARCKFFLRKSGSSFLIPRQIDPIRTFKGTDRVVPDFRTINENVYEICHSYGSTDPDPIYRFECGSSRGSVYCFIFTRFISTFGSPLTVTFMPKKGVGPTFLLHGHYFYFRHKEKEVREILVRKEKLKLLERCIIYK
ncbi:hypothetical protein AVEN_18054-1 [Araneus ventricosus]|uniref:Uncharacterized protein n=1 Tax=Araneus ventricosus TaxID=182803 RepID=A0A4Y2H239_ARAVE|nr:hypothetical protein AVEN_18054-1 [Araneus ventricosus]